MFQRICKFLFLLALLWPGTSWGVVAFVQSGGTTTDSGTTADLTLGSNCTSGDVLVGSIVWTPNTITLNSVTSTRSGTATLLNNPTADANNNSRAAMFAVAVTSTGSCVITATFSGTLSSIGFVAHEYSGADTANIIDNSGAAHAMQEQFIPADVNSFSSGSFTTTTDNAMLVGFFHDININDDGTPGSGWTGRITVQTSSRTDTEDKILATAGSTNALFTAGTVFRAVTVGGLAIKPASGGGGGASAGRLLLLGVGP